MRARWVTSIDVRTETEYGTLRAYSRAGFQTTTGETTQGKIYTERGFIQFADSPSASRSPTSTSSAVRSATAAFTRAVSRSTLSTATLLAAYTATFGNGFTATLALEDQFMRRNAIWDASNDAQNALVIGNMPGPGAAQNPTMSRRSTSATWRPPVSRTSWERCVSSRSGARHRSQAPCTSCARATTATTRPARAQRAGRGRLPSWPRTMRTAGPRWRVSSSTCRGRRAIGSTSKPPSAKAPALICGLDGGIGASNNNFARFNGANVTPAWAMDSMFGTLVSTNGATGQQLTRFFSLHGAIEHYWTPALRSRASGAPTRRRTTTTSRRRSSARHRRARYAACRSEHPADGRDGCGGLRPGLEHLGGRRADDLESGTAVRHWPRSVLHESRDEADPGQMVFNFAGAGGRAAGVYFPASVERRRSILRLQRNFWP